MHPPPLVENVLSSHYIFNRYEIVGGRVQKNKVRCLPAPHRSAYITCKPVSLQVYAFEPGDELVVDIDRGDRSDVMCWTKIMYDPGKTFFGIIQLGRERPWG
jgi:hypothetical protein